MNSGKKIQINVYLQKMDGFNETYKQLPVGGFYLPVLWIRESFMIDEEGADRFRSDVLDNF